MKKIYFMRIFLIILLAVTAIATILIYPVINKTAGSAERAAVMLTIWQIDGFEGGKGSRKRHIEKVAENIFKDERVYVTVVSLTSESARENINAGNIPDLISYPAGFYGIENIVADSKNPYSVWCEGRYMLLTLDESADFSDVSSDNTIINCGVDNAVDAAALFVGLDGAEKAEPTEAYLKLLSGKYKYLLGTQRDIFRLEVRNADYKVNVVTEFNDLYQCISCITRDSEKSDVARELIEALEVSDVSNLGLFSAKNESVNEKLRGLNVECKKTIKGFCSESYIKNIDKAVKNLDLIKLKSLI